ncbi:MAG: hypothetical protein U5N55_07800 [Cypionkella sp.]|nr:hypothetical protein [Cypionkella sp.]
MTQFYIRSGLALALILASGAALAGPIETACNKSSRKAASRPLCNCIQQIADQTLANADQRRAAEFFKNPDKAHATWVSKTGRDDAFWERYKQFGSYAEQYCAGSAGG